MMYDWIRPWLYCLDAERAHELTVRGLRMSHGIGLTSVLGSRGVEAPVSCAGLTFPNPLGLAAGMDKDAKAVDAFGALGFGFVEVGTLTPLPQPGNPKPRLVRIPGKRAVINRMGFNNHGVEAAVERLRRRRFKGIVGVNIGKNKDTPQEEAARDYVTCFDAVYDVADYIAVNISSPNTERLRELQGEDELPGLLSAIAAARGRNEDRTGKRVPLFVKISPDMDDDELSRVADTLLAAGVDGIIATNTTIDRKAVPDHRDEPGGLSGAPLTERSRQVVAHLRASVGPDVPLVGVGGIMTADDAMAMLDAGADLVQLYTGLVYGGPELVRAIHVALSARDACP